MIACIQIVLRSLTDLVGLAVLAIRPRWSVEAENLVLRRQLGLFEERGLKPRRGIVNLVGIDAKSGRDGNDDVGRRDCRSTDRFEARKFAPLCEATARDLPVSMSREKMPTRTEKRRDRPNDDRNRSARPGDLKPRIRRSRSRVG